MFDSTAASSKHHDFVIKSSSPRESREKTKVEIFLF